MISSGKAQFYKSLTESKRLYFRPMVESDISDTYVQALNDPSVVGLTEARHKKWAKADLLDYVRSSNVDGVSKLIGIFIKENDKHIGNIRLFNFHPVHKRAELGIMIFDKSEWSKGYASESLEAVVSYAFSKLNLYRIHADYYASNAGSQKIFSKAGFVIEGIYKDHFNLNGTFVDSVRVAKINPNKAV